MLCEEDIEDEIEKNFQKMFDEEIDDTIKNYFEYLESSHEVKNRTLNEKSIEIYSTISLAYEHLSYNSYLFDAGCFNLAYVLLEVNDDIESSIFLSIHGKYRPAKALLRRWLETTIRAICHDCQIENSSENPIKHKKYIKNGCDWLKKSPYHRFSGKIDKGGNESILNILIDPDTDHIAQQLLKEKYDFKDISFIKYIENLYGNLSKSVHFSGIDVESSDELNLEFAKYDKELFDEWYTYLNIINEICNILIFLKYPKMLTLYKERKITIPALETNQRMLLEKLL